MEQGILNFIYNYLNFEFFTVIFKFITYSGDKGAIYIFLSLMLIINKKTRKIGLYCLISLIIGFLITEFTLKPIICRLRPYEYRDIVLKIAKETSYSFPSGHTTAAFAVSFVLLKERFIYKNFKIYKYVLAYSVLMAYSRLYFYVHFPSDVIGGVFVAYLSTIISKFIVDKFYFKFSS